MDAVTGALIAALVGWLSIIVVVSLPAPRVHVSSRAVRQAGAASIATIALSALGLGLPMWVALAVFAVVLAGHVLLRRAPVATTAG